MKYFFILGNNPTLSLAELYSVFGSLGVLSIGSKSVAFLETNKELDPDKTIRQLGGTIKLGCLKDRSIPNAKELINKIEKILEPKPGKFKFGISNYGNGKLNLRSIGMTIKTNLKNNGHSVRYVTSQEKTLSSVVVEQNKLTTKGQEIVLIEDKNIIHLGQTLAVQPFKELSFRDYGRPARDDHSGMLPPKLAQIMINLSQATPESTILDPFCGSGTILSEAVLMGYKNILGSDVSPQAVLDSKKNVRWITDKFNIIDHPSTRLGAGKLQIINSDATKVGKIFSPNSIDAIITEPYLGPQRGKIDTKKVITELESLYGKALNEFKTILKPGARIVMIWPRFYINQKTFPINPKITGYSVSSPLPRKLLSGYNLSLTDRQTIIYGRPNQRVWREIVILEKNK